MRKLRAHGFSNHDLEVILGGVWKEATIKRYTRGVKIVDTIERDEIMQTITELAARGIVHDDVQQTLEINRQLEKEGLTQEKIIQFFSNIRELRINLTDWINLQQEILELDVSIKEIETILNFIKKLREADLTTENITQLIGEAVKHQNISQFLQVISKYDNILTIQTEYNQLQENFENLKKTDDALKSLIERQETQYMTYQTYIDMAKKLINDYNFDIISLSTIMDIIQKMGNPFQVLNAINVYKNLEELNAVRLEELAKYNQLHDKIKKLTAEKITLEVSVIEMMTKVGEITSSLEGNLILQNIKEIIIKPQEADIAPVDFMRIALLLMTGMNSFATHHRLTIPDWEKHVKYNMILATEAITRMV